LATHRKSFVWQRSILLLALLAAGGGFSIGLIMTASRAFHQTSLLPPPQFRQGHTGKPDSISVKALAQVEASKSAMLGGLEQEAKVKSLVVSVPRQFQGTIVSEAKLNASDKVIALTFDDGPWLKTTEQVLDILKQKGVKATFFWIGEPLQNYPKIAQRVVADGNAVGNHTWHHWYRRMDEATAAHEIDRTEDLIYKTTGVRTFLFRPPGGILHNGLPDYAKNNKYVVVMWSSLAQEFNRRASSRTLVNDVLRSAKSGGIVLLHDGGGNHHKTVEALPQIIDGLRQRGYRFVTVPQLLEMQDKEQRVTTANKPALPTGAVQRP